MKKFIYNEDDDGLHSYAYDWLDRTGLKETLWIIDYIYLRDFFNNQTFNQWSNE